ncbi:hypothetical protein D3C81_469500 [compost metagenome]
MTTNLQARGADRIEFTGMDRNAVVSVGGSRTVGKDFVVRRIPQARHRAIAILARRPKHRGIELQRGLIHRTRLAGAGQREAHRLGIAFQQRPRRAFARGLLQREAGIAGFVVLRIAAQRIGGGQDGLGRQGIHDPGIGDTELRRSTPRAIAHALRRAEGHRAAGQAVEFDPERARQQGIG